MRKKDVSISNVSELLEASHGSLLDLGSQDGGGEVDGDVMQQLDDFIGE